MRVQCRGCGAKCKRTGPPCRQIAAANGRCKNSWRKDACALERRVRFERKHARLKQNGLRIMTRRPDGKLRRKMAFICHQIFGLLQKFSALTQCPAHIVRRDARSSSSRFTIASIPGWIWRSSAPHCLTALPVRVRERPNPTWLKCRGCGPCDRACRARPAGVAGHLSLVA